MTDKEKGLVLAESPSRRSFLGMSSVALATAAFAGLTANAQEKASTQKAEHDHSSSDPGPENKTLLGENPDANTPPPTDHGDIVPIWYSFDLVKKRVEEGGWTHEVTQRVLPSSKEIAGVQMRLTAGSYRELHWHTADEWAYVLTGNARVTVMNPDGTMFIGDVSEGDLWLFPAGYPHSIQGLGPDGTEFLLVFNQGMFSEDGTMLLSETVAHIPPEVLAKNTGLDKSVFAQTPGAPLYIFPGNLPNSLEQDKTEIGGEQVASKYQYTFRMRSMQPTTASQAGEVRVVDSHNFPVSKKVAAALLIIKPGHMREIHWHPNASEWQYYVAGKGRMTVFYPVDNARTMDFSANDVGYVPSNAPHYVENIGDTDLVVLELFAAEEFMDVSLNQWLRRVPSEMLKAHLNIGKEMATRIPAEKLELV
ncbi:cupin domain-containing protein [Alloacidobacterium dinghuense]|uniref:Cupin domain-containing protein n=1 Tax=Alloacidobacterium dinghuense TaxID=2763107 RepID=A0A7G8BLH4_9BACT|nr:cupin domain-containing protein [Alloacidobacterium dinghuense]QNI33394.1 cupin domain-containing protein [Alloacidobacterium dinghuense]